MLLPDPKSTKSRRQAATIFALMVRTIQIARAVSDPQLAEEILEDVVQAALKLSYW
jgi:TetR/AcrR family transcriptional regulator, transcriptional repressor for nem operon